MALSIPAAFPTTEALKLACQAVAANNQSPPAIADEVIEQARSASYGEILGRLLKQGYSKTQVDAWDRLPEFGRHIALWWIWRERVGANQGDYPAETHPAHWDRRSELDEVLLTIDGEIEDPEGDGGTGIVSGRMDTSDDTFIIGEVQW